MKIYWSYRSVPELQELPKKEAKAIFKKCWKKTMNENKKIVWKSEFISVLTVALVTGLCMWALALLFPWLAYGPEKTPWPFVSTYFIGGFSGSIPRNHFMTKSSLLHIREALRERLV